jgi:hypothetical protein
VKTAIASIPRPRRGVEGSFQKWVVGVAANDIANDSPPAPHIAVHNRTRSRVLTTSSTRPLNWQSETGKSIRWKNLCERRAMDQRVRLLILANFETYLGNCGYGFW